MNRFHRLLGRQIFFFGALFTVFGALLTGVLMAADPSPESLMKKIDGQFYYPQNETSKGFKMRVQYTGADKFIASKLDEKAGEKAGNYYVIYDHKNGLRFDVSSIHKRLSGAVEAILREQQDSIIPPTIRNSLKNYIAKTHNEPPYLKLYAYFDKAKIKNRLPPIVRVEYFLNKSFQVERTHAYLHTGERIDSKWDLIKSPNGKFMISKNTIVIFLKKGKIFQQNSYSYKNVKGLMLPEKIVMKSKFETGETVTETLVFSAHEVF